MKIISNIPIVFVVARGRSGTTMLQSILDAHLNICAPIEAKFILHLKTKYKKTTVWNEKTINTFIKDVFTNRKFRLFWEVTPQQLKKLFDQYKVNNFSDACKLIYLSHHSMFPKQKIQLIVDKNPLHARFVFQLFEVFPDAKFIHLIRDSRAVAYSHLKSKMQQNIAQMAYDWNRLNKSIENFKKQHPNLFYTIKYEKLVTNPKVEFKNIFDFIEMPFQEKLLEANVTIKQKYKSNRFLSLSHHKNITNPINNLLINSWKEGVAANEVAIINFICSPLLSEYQYKFTISKLTIYQKTEVACGKLISKLVAVFLNLLFKLPFTYRSFLYAAVSLFKDKQFKN